jgi:hypothetical protein
MPTAAPRRHAAIFTAVALTHADDFPAMLTFGHCRPMERRIAGGTLGIHSASLDRA